LTLNTCRLPTTLVVQFKPHYIAAGSLCLAAEFHNVDLSQNEIIWWHVFDVALDPLKGTQQIKLFSCYLSLSYISYVFSLPSLSCHA
jgi:hypothetical protein